MIRSRVTLAMIEAAAIDTERASPSTIVRTGRAGGAWLPSTSAKRGASPSARTASRHRPQGGGGCSRDRFGSHVADADAESADSMMLGERLFACLGVICFESFRPCGIFRDRGSPRPRPQARPAGRARLRRRRTSMRAACASRQVRHEIRSRSESSSAMAQVGHKLKISVNCSPACGGWRRVVASVTLRC